MMTKAEFHLLSAAREWLVDRAPQDTGEKALAAAICRAYPEDMDTKDSDCPCGESGQCDECMTYADAQNMIDGWERDSVNFVPDRPRPWLKDSLLVAGWWLAIPCVLVIVSTWLMGGFR